MKAKARAITEEKRVKDNRVIPRKDIQQIKAGDEMTKETDGKYRS